jgi:hypothetical protein
MKNSHKQMIEKVGLPARCPNSTRKPYSLFYRLMARIVEEDSLFLPPEAGLR